MANVTFTLTGFSKSGKAVYHIPGVTGSLSIRKSMFAGEAPKTFSLEIGDGIFAAPKEGKGSRVTDPAVAEERAKKAQERADKAAARAAKLMEQVARIKAKQAPAAPEQPAAEPVAEQAADSTTETPEPVVEQPTTETRNEKLKNSRKK